MIKKSFIDLRFFIFFSGCVVANAKTIAQKTDTLLPIRDFINVSTGYKQMPLYLELEIKNSTNFITSDEDTADITGQFFLRNENSYVRFGEFEQVVNDSLALLVSDRLQRMILYTNAGPVVKKMKALMGMVMPDSSVHRIADQYKSFTNKLSKESATIELQSRAILYGTELPRETIQLQYDVSKKTPQQVTTVIRSLLRIDSLQYSQLQTGAALAGKLLAVEGNYFLVKEQTTAYVYKQIETASASLKVPVLTSDRIIKNEEGEYKPVKNYELYNLTQE